MFEQDEIDLWDGEMIEDPRGIDDYFADRWTAGRGYGNSAPLDAQRMILAERTVKSFIDTFTTAGEQYVVTFGEGKATYSNREARQVRITSDPLYDTGLSDEEAARVLVGFACHEASHSRYGAEHEQRARRTFGKDARSAHTLSNLLDDAYIERAFQREYPGWTGVFAAATKWAAQENPSTVPSESPLLRGVQAVRYSESFDWTGNEDELSWWTNWARTFAVQSADKHVEGVRVALEHIVEQAQPDQPNKPQPEQGNGDRDDSGGVVEDSDQPQPGEGGADEPEDKDGEQAEEPGDAKRKSPREIAEEADKASSDEDITEALRQSEMTTSGNDPSLDGEARGERDEAANDAMQELSVLEQATHGDLVEHRRARSLPQIKRTFDLQTSGSAAAAIRNAFARSRGGHTEITKGTTRGRCDNGSLYRIAAGDPRLFHRRSSPSPDNWLVWVLIDWSGSMGGNVAQTLSAARALAAASRSVGQMRLAVKLWTSPQNSSMASAGVTDLWETGDSLDRLNDAARVNMGATPDATVMGWARKAILREARGSERTMIVFLSDGEGQHSLGDEVAEARKAGTEVISMALDRLSRQTEIYGEDRAIPYTGSITKAAGPLARMLTRVMR